MLNRYDAPKWVPIDKNKPPRKDWMNIKLEDPLVDVNRYWTGVNCNGCPFLDVIASYKRCSFYSENLDEDCLEFKPSFCRLLEVEVVQEKQGIFEEHEILCGCDIGSFCSCSDPDFVKDSRPMPDRDGWCRKCNKPVYRAGGEGSFVYDLKVPIKDI